MIGWSVGCTLCLCDRVQTGSKTARKRAALPRFVGCRSRRPKFWCRLSGHRAQPRTTRAKLVYRSPRTAGGRLTRAPSLCCGLFKVAFFSLGAIPDLADSQTRARPGLPISSRACCFDPVVWPPLFHTNRARKHERTLSRSSFRRGERFSNRFSRSRRKRWRAPSSSTWESSFRLSRRSGSTECWPRFSWRRPLPLTRRSASVGESWKGV